MKRRYVSCPVKIDQLEDFADSSDMGNRLIQMVALLPLGIHWDARGRDRFLRC